MHTLEIHGNKVTLDFNLMTKDQALQVIAHWAALGEIDQRIHSSWVSMLDKL
jgi:hypothetical protein